MGRAGAGARCRPATAAPGEGAGASKVGHRRSWDDLAERVTTMSVPPRALSSGMMRGRSARGTAALTA